MPWEWYHEVSVWAAAVAIHAIVVRWCCMGMRKNLWREMYWRAYSFSLPVCAAFSIFWAIDGRHISNYLEFALFQAFVFLPAITTFICGIVAGFLNRSNVKSGRTLPSSS